MMLTKEQILGADDATREPIEIPEWGGAVHVRVMSGAARDAWEQRVLGTDRANIRAALAAATVCDEQGNLLFSEAEIPSLGAKSGAALSRIFNVAMRLNRVSSGDVNELAKN